jgi:hypothetical protein
MTIADVVRLADRRRIRQRSLAAIALSSRTA